jgi:O-antigen ligase
MAPGIGGPTCLEQLHHGSDRKRRRSSANRARYGPGKRKLNVTPMTPTRPNRSEYAGLNRLAFALLWIFIFCVPWEEEVAIAGGVAMSHFVGAASVLVGVLACVASGRIRPPGSLHYLLAGLVVWSALTYYWSVAPDLTVIRVTSYAQLLLMVWLIWEFAPTEERQTSLLAAYVLGTYVSALSTIYSFVTGRGDNLGISEGRYTAPGFNENELGIILALGLVMSCYLLAKNKGPRAIWFIHVPTCVLAICLTGSRGSFISAAIALLMFPLSLGSFSRAQKKFGALALVVVLASGIAIVPRATWDRIGSIEGEISEGTLTKRTYIWAAGMDVFREHPLLGVGAGAFGASVYNKLDVPYVAHNSYLSVLVEMGLIGELLFIALLAALVHAAMVLPKLESRAWTLLLVTWAVAVLSVTWEHRKPTWFVFGMLMAQAAVLRDSRSVAMKPVRGARGALRYPAEGAGMPV